MVPWHRLLRKWLGSLPIRQKLILITMVGSGLALFAAFVIFITFEMVQTRRILLREVAVITEIVGNNSTAALIFNDAEAAIEILSALRYEKNVIAAGLYKGNHLFAAFTGRPQTVLPATTPPIGHTMTRAAIHITRPIYLDGESIGTIYLVYDLSIFKVRLIQYAVVVFFGLLTATGVAFGVISRLQGTISGPILHLSEIANRVSEKKDYALRAVKMQEDELGRLVDHFNEMLAKIEAHEKALRESQEELEERVRERTRELQEQILERERAEKEKEAIQAQLLHAQKMEAVGILAGGIAHDFNNLLTGIQGCTELMLQEHAFPQPVLEDLRQIQIAVERAADLTRQLLLFSRKQPLAFTVLDLNKLLEDLLRLLHRLIGEDISINTHFERHLWPVRGDQGTLQQVIMNLTVNARDAMPHGGSFSITTENILLAEEAPKTHPKARPGRFVKLTFVDTGVGMDEETLQRIFEPFFTTKGLGKGTGLGLSVVYGIVEQHGGWMEVTSRPGEGARFEIYLPAVYPPPWQAAVSQPLRLEDFRGKGERILLVEDEESVREFLTRAMTRYGYEVVACASLKEALEVFSREEGRFDLLFSDVVLTDGHGLDLAEALLNQKPDLRILLCSGYTDGKSQWERIEKRGFHFIAKPFVLGSLLSALRTALQPDEDSP